MLKKTLTFEDYNGETRTEDFYFNLTKAELAEMELRVGGGMEAMINRMINERDSDKLTTMFKDIILSAYGEKSLDGRRFIKSQELIDSFVQTEAYSDLFISLISDQKEVESFIRGIMPKEVREATKSPAPAKKVK